MILWGLGAAKAAGFAIVFWAVSFVPVTAIALVALWRRRKRLARDIMLGGFAGWLLSYCAKELIGRARPGDLREIAGDPRGWLEDQLDASAVPESFAALGSSQTHYGRFDAARRAGTEALVKYLRGPGLDVLKKEGALRTLAAVRSETPFRERWVQF